MAQPAAPPKVSPRRAALQRGAVALGIASLAACVRRCGWAALERESVADAWACAFLVLAWGSSALAALAGWQLATDGALGGNGACDGDEFASYASAAVLVGAGAVASYAGVYMETVVAIDRAPLLVEGVYGVLCTSGGMLVAAGLYEAGKRACVWFLNNHVPPARRLAPGQPVPGEFTALVLAAAAQSALVVSLLEGELLHYDMADPGIAPHAVLRRALHDCLNPCSVALLALGVRALAHRVLFPAAAAARGFALGRVVFSALCGVLLMLLFAFAAVHEWQLRGFPRAAVFSTTGLRGMALLGTAAWDAWDAWAMAKSGPTPPRRRAVGRAKTE